ncbi:MAG: ParB/RepB/Spo0J family partition protein [Limnohabitans sp.]|nr:ParB/RepB/Spo0J family partition protein [Limnohabitans sp.]
MQLSNVIPVKLSEIIVQDSNVRTDLNSENSQENLKELAENIRLNGLLQPIVLRGVQGNPPYEVIVGQRRFLAHKLLNEEKINATFSGEIEPIQALLLSLSENMCRQEMNFEDTSTAITKLYTHFNKKEQEVKNHTGFSIRMIRSYVKIEEQATEKIKQYLRNGEINLVDAKRAIDAAQGDEEKANFYIDEIKSLTTYEKKRLVEEGTKNPNGAKDKILEDAKKPKFEETIILNLPLKINKALVAAAEKLSIDKEELTMNALVAWLKVNDFLVD